MRGPSRYLICWARCRGTAAGPGPASSRWMNDSYQRSIKDRGTPVNHGCMSSAHVLEHQDIVQSDYGFRVCPHCEFMMPEGPRYCWSCGRSMAQRKKRVSTARKKRGSTARQKRNPTTPKKRNSTVRQNRGPVSPQKRGSTAPKKRDSAAPKKSGYAARARHPSRSRG